VATTVRLFMAVSNSGCRKACVSVHECLGLRWRKV